MRRAVALIVIAGLIVAACASDEPADTSTTIATTTTTTTTLPTAESVGLPWWNDRVFYEVFVRSFNDSDGDGIGDLQGVIDKLDYLNDGDPSTTDDLGVTGIWLMPVFQSPSYHGYDVIDYRNIERDYGTTEDLRRLVQEAHDRGIAVIIDYVINHSSRNHEWFVASKDPESDFEDWYIWEDLSPGYDGPWGQQVWHSRAGRFYYGLFWEGMPDLNLENPDVTAELHDIAEYWLDVGVDGFRLDAAKHLIEDGSVQENTPETHAWLAEFHDVVRDANAESLIVGEIWTSTQAIAMYGPDEIDLAFEFNLADAVIEAVQSGNPATLETVQRQVVEAFDTHRYASFLANHDQTRVGTRLLGNQDNLELAATILLTSPGVPFLYYGEEVGMVGNKPDERLRTPMQWTANPENAGFTTGRPWERLQDDVETLNVETQDGDPDSLLNHYREMIQLRSAVPALRIGEWALLESSHPKVYAFSRTLGDETVVVIANLSRNAVDDYAVTGLPAGDTTLLHGSGTLAAIAANTPYQPLPSLPGKTALVISVVQQQP
ncbi:MAG: alpha-amylase [Acidimicrobiia bacterium]|nr:alpha-amylase [Acidimicrobiia bacterium]